MPLGLTLTLPATGILTGGTGVPEFDDAIANLGEQEFEYVAMPFTDSTSLMAWELEYGFSDDGRWGWKRQLFGHIFSAKRGAYADLITFGETRNSGVMSIMGFEVAIAVAGVRMGGGLHGQGAARPDQRSGASAADAGAQRDQAGAAAVSASISSN